MKKSRILALLIATMAIFAVFKGVNAPVRAEEAVNTKSKAMVLMDYNTGKVLKSNNEDKRLQIASMVKIMTLNIIFDEVEKGTLNVDDDITVSERAASMGGSQAFLDAHETYKAGELIKSIIVASANDSCVALAEHIAGSVENFTARMNDKAQKLGLENTCFVNCTGLPAPNQYCCASDAAVMFRELIKHKEFFDYSKIWMFDFVHPSGRITGLTNTNKLIRFYEGCDGGKTGFTSEALSCLAATAKRGNTRLIAVVIGAPDSKTRNAQVASLFNEGFSGYETKQYVFGGVALCDANVSCGKEKSVRCAPKEDYFMLTNRGEKADVKVEAEMCELSAPVKTGDKAGKLTVIVNGEKVKEIDLIALDEVEKKGLMDIIDDFITNW